MAMSKIERIDREIQKTREKITEYQNKLKGLLVRSMRLTPAELNAMLSGGGIPGMAAAVPEETADYDEEQEDTENE